jgi:formylglycine-generating enzyme required for sulfatase activity
MGLPAPTADEASLPVVNLSRDDAQTFCRRLSAVTGKSYRLPTEAEWEYACRAGGPAVVDPETFAQQAWHMNNSKGLFQPVGTKPPNRWGLHDMLGNATEWCADAYTVAGPPSGSDPVVPPEVAKSGVVRGGDKNSVAAGSRPTARTPLQPQFPYRSAGIRVVLDDPALPAASP